MFPEFRSLRRQDRLRNLDHLPNQRFRLGPKGEINPALRTEHVGHDRITASLHPREQQRRPTFANHTAMNLGHFEVWINLGFNCDDFVFSGESIEKCSQAGVHSDGLWPVWSFLDSSRAAARLRHWRTESLFDLVGGDLRGFRDVWLV